MNIFTYTDAHPVLTFVWLLLITLCVNSAICAVCDGIAEIVRAVWGREG